MAKQKDLILQLYKADNTVFTAKDIALIWQETNLNTLKSKIHYYVKRGSLQKIRRGIYSKDSNYNRYELGTKIYTPSYISLETVLQNEGVIFQNYQSIFVISYLSREIHCDNQNYVLRKLKDDILMEKMGIEVRNNYSIATKERAFLDAIYLYQDYSFDNLGSINWDLCFEISNIYSNKSLLRRLNSYYMISQNA